MKKLSLILYYQEFLYIFSFLINVKKINGKLVSKRMMEHLFEMAHRFHSIGKNRSSSTF